MANTRFNSFEVHSRLQLWLGEPPLHVERGEETAYMHPLLWTLSFLPRGTTAASCVCSPRTGVGKPPRPDLPPPVWTGSTTLQQQRVEPPAVAPTSGSSSGASSSSSGARLPVKATLLLQTNVPSGDGAAVEWSNPLLASNQGGHAGEGRWQGGKSVLKSALQKCVRLGHPAEAVR